MTDRIQILKTTAWILGIFCGLYCWPTFAGAQSMASVEDKTLAPLPAAVDNAIEEFIGKGGKHYTADCTHVGKLVTLKGQRQRKVYFVTVRGTGCQGSSASPIWIVEVSGLRPHILIAGSGNSRRNP